MYTVKELKKIFGKKTYRRVYKYLLIMSKKRLKSVGIIDNQVKNQKAREWAKEIMQDIVCYYL